MKIAAIVGGFFLLIIACASVVISYAVWVRPSVSLGGLSVEVRDVEDDLGVATMRTTILKFSSETERQLTINSVRINNEYTPPSGELPMVMTIGKNFTMNVETRWYSKDGVLFDSTGYEKNVVFVDVDTSDGAKRFHVKSH